MLGLAWQCNFSIWMTVELWDGRAVQGGCSWLVLKSSIKRWTFYELQDAGLSMFILE